MTHAVLTQPCMLLKAAASLNHTRLPVPQICLLLEEFQRGSAIDVQGTLSAGNHNENMDVQFADRLAVEAHPEDATPKTMA